MIVSYRESSRCNRFTIQSYPNILIPHGTNSSTIFLSTWSANKTLVLIYLSTTEASIWGRHLDGLFTKVTFGYFRSSWKPTSFPGRSVGTGTREPWERGWLKAQWKCPKCQITGYISHLSTPLPRSKLNDSLGIIQDLHWTNQKPRRQTYKDCKAPRENRDSRKGGKDSIRWIRFLIGYETCCLVWLLRVRFDNYLN